MECNNKFGAPVGGRVHWFIHNLPNCIKRAYKIEFDYEYHNYYLVRKRKMLLRDCFIIVRTSRRCWRCMYYNSDYEYFEYLSAMSSKDLVCKIERIYIKMRNAEFAEVAEKG